MSNHERFEMLEVRMANVLLQVVSESVSFESSKDCKYYKPVLEQKGWCLGDPNTLKGARKYDGICSKFRKRQ